jgi:hypothetical protein
VLAVFGVLSGTIIHSHGPIETVGRVVGFHAEDAHPHTVWATTSPSSLLIKVDPCNGEECIARIV